MRVDDAIDERLARAGERALEAVQHRRQIVRVHELAERPPDVGLRRRVGHRRDRRTDVGEPLVGADLEDDVVQRLDQLAIALLGFEERGLGPPPPVALARLDELALDRGHETGQAVLADVVVRARAHRRDGDFLADLSGDDDHRQIEPAAADDLQRRERAELRHDVVAGDDVPIAVTQGGGQRRGGVDASMERLVAAATQLVHEQFGIVLAVLDEEDVERHRHTRVTEYPSDARR